MKKILFLSLFISFKMFGQAIELKPGNFGFVMIPNVSTFGTCIAPYKGRIVYYSTDNSLRMCNGSIWVNISSGSNLIPYNNNSNLLDLNSLRLTNTNASNTFPTIYASTYSGSNASAIVGYSDNETPTSETGGVKGFNLSTNSEGYGVYGSHSGTGSGVYGIAGYGYGVSGKTNGGIGIYGSSTTGIAAKFNSNNGGYALKTYGKIQLNGLFSSGTNKFLKSTNLLGDADWSDLFPYSFSDFSAEPLLTLTNTHTGNYDAAVFQTNTEAAYSGVVGRASNTSPNNSSRGVSGENLSTNSLGSGVYGYHAGTGSGVWGYSSSGKGVRGNSDGGIAGYFYSNNFALITDKGTVGFGNITPSLNSDERVEINGRLRIRDSTSTAGVWFNNSANGIGIDNGAFYGLENNTSGSERAGIWIGSAWRFTINRVGNANFTGTVTATGFPIASDFRYKKNIKPLENTLSKVQKIVGVSYDLRKDEFPEKNFSNQPQIGFIAQDIEKIFPEMVFTDEKGYKSVDYARLTPVLVEALKELTLKNQTLENKNQTLETRLDKIEAMLSTIQPNTENLNSKK